MKRLLASKQQAEDLKSVLARDDIDTGLSRALEKFKEITPGYLTPESLQETLEEIFADEDFAKLLGSNIFYFSNAFDRGRIEPQSSVDEIAQEIQLDKKFNSNLNKLVSLIEVPSVSVAVKMAYLSYDHPSTFSSPRIISDFRPVMNPDSNQVSANILLMSLQFMAHDRYGTKPKSYTLSLTDIRELKRCCDRAISKAEELEQFLVEKVGVPVYLPEEE